jgi:hypothetical protein
MFAISKEAYLSKLVQGSRPYRAFPFNKASLPVPLFIYSYHESIFSIRRHDIWHNDTCHDNILHTEHNVMMHVVMYHLVKL